MTGLAIAADALPLLAGLAALALLLFLLASRLGRWPLWLTAYALTLLAIAIAFFFRDPDVHVQRSPADGVVDYVERRAGRFAPAWSERAADNESAVVGISTGQVRVLRRQVAGTIARRIVTYVEEGELVDQAERIHPGASP